jgi:hypothetical protein
MSMIFPKIIFGVSIRDILSPLNGINSWYPYDQQLISLRSPTYVEFTWYYVYILRSYNLLFESTLLSSSAGYRHHRLEQHRQ